jgi:hypothetical protein
MARQGFRRRLAVHQPQLGTHVNQENRLKPAQIEVHIMKMSFRVDLISAGALLYSCFFFTIIHIPSLELCVTGY